MKPNTKFEFSVRDIELIENALRGKMNRRGWSSENEKFEKESKEIQELLGKIHQQKIWYRPKDKTYVGG
jgi:translation initiation factor IF-1